MTLLRVTYLVEAKALDLLVPGECLEEAVQLLGGISEAGEVLTKHDDYIGANFLCLFDQLQLVESLVLVSTGLIWLVGVKQTTTSTYSSSRLIIAGDDNLFLLHSQRQRAQLWILILEHGSIEAILAPVS